MDDPRGTGGVERIGDLTANSIASTRAKRFTDLVVAEAGTWGRWPDFW